MLELKRGGYARVQTEMVEFIGLPFLSSKKVKIWSFLIVVAQGRQKNVQKSVMHMQNCCFANIDLFFFYAAFAVAVMVS